MNGGEDICPEAGSRESLKAARSDRSTRYRREFVSMSEGTDIAPDAGTDAVNASAHWDLSYLSVASVGFQRCRGHIGNLITRWVMDRNRGKGYASGVLLVIHFRYRTPISIYILTLLTTIYIYKQTKGQLMSVGMSESMSEGDHCQYARGENPGALAAIARRVRPLQGRNGKTVLNQERHS
jgi:hypothetical protein